MQIPAIRYSRDTTDFTKTLRARVDAYFKEKNLSRKGDWRLHLKTSLMLALYFVPWALVTWGVTGSGWEFWVAEFAMG
ncbi:MAG: acyl-CoA desaturase, partial [Bacteroidetes bacterium]|nr:acyl-CoA desaturase [Bacteroidota bacterium]